MFCTKCGTQLSDKNKFCTVCGNPVKRVSGNAENQTVSDNARNIGDNKSLGKDIEIFKYYDEENVEEVVPEETGISYQKNQEEDNYPKHVVAEENNSTVRTYAGNRNTYKKSEDEFSTDREMLDENIEEAKHLSDKEQHKSKDKVHSKKRSIDSNNYDVDASYVNDSISEKQGKRRKGHFKSIVIIILLIVLIIGLALAAFWLLDGKKILDSVLGNIINVKTASQVEDDVDAINFDGDTDDSLEEQSLTDDEGSAEGYIDKLDNIPEKVLDAMDINIRKGIKKKLEDEGNEALDVTLLGYYFLKADKGIEPYNYLYLVYEIAEEIEADSGLTQTKYYYSYGYYEDIKKSDSVGDMVDIDGYKLPDKNENFKFDKDDKSKHSGYKDLDSMYENLILTRLDYDLESTVESTDHEETENVEEEIEDNLLSEDTIRDIIDKYDDYYSDNYTGKNSCMRLDYLNSDDIPEMVVKYDGIVDVFEYVNGDVCAIAAFRDKDNTMLFSTTEDRMILYGVTDHGWYYVYSLSPSGPSYVDGMHSLIDPATGASVYYRVDRDLNVLGQVTADEFAAFRNKYKDDKCIVYTIGNGKIFRDADDAYDYLVASPDKNDKDRLSGSQIAKIKAKSIEASSTLETASKDGMTYEAEHMIDGDMKTTWSEGAKGLGENETITIQLNGRHEIASLKIYNGFLKDKRRYAINGKVSKLEIDYGNGYTQVISPDIMDIDDAEEALFSLEELNPTVVTAPAKCVTDTIKLTILDAKAGSKYKDVGISEIEIFGR